MGDLFCYLLSEMARFFQTPSLWQLFSGFLVPIGVAGVAAWLVIRQIKQLDRHRSEDRKANAFAYLTDLLLAHVEIADTSMAEAAERAKSGHEDLKGTFTITDKHRTNGMYVKALSLLEGSDKDVAIWTNYKAHSLHAISIQMVKIHGLSTSNKIGPGRATVFNECSKAMDLLTQWVKGEVPTQRFSSELPELKVTYPI